MRVVAFNGSPRKDGNTAILIRHVFIELEQEGIETELVQLAGKPLRGCLACYKCWVNADQQCVQKGDELNEYVQKMVRADGIILGSPGYVSSVPAEMKALIAVRRGGQLTAFDTINHFFFMNEVIVPGSSYWNFAFGLEKGDVDQDEEGIQTMKVLGQNMAWLLKKIHA